ncbi:MAG: hypothetical protein AUH78_18620 [Gemmatimonadetes bacterium 13_1_40CM_4_69_8]|nr:MAG: hypothetical protein AUH46_07390 [Gemmatimonadetes bacterium 13_1_40CM_70_15]OLC71308.1 MAG: hypothetical protein AUH78_18620 [Gemmatimonadetes bacterium 13_1_40CM_4_69_8]PYP71488.1 MAG: hypothetical protein DMD41_12245 [Gemmatimonadota bacterium]
MNGDFAILLFWFGISLTANVALGIAWFRTSRRVRHLENRPDLSQFDDIAARVEQAVDALAGRVEELANGQEFLNRVLSDRLDKLGRALPLPEARDPSR